MIPSENVDENAVQDVPLENEEGYDIPLSEVPEKADSVRREEAMLVTAVQAGYGDNETPNLLELYNRNYDATMDATPSELVGPEKNKALEEDLVVAANIAVDKPELSSEYMSGRVAEMKHDSSAHQLAVESIASIDDDIAQAQAANSYVQYRMWDALSKTSNAEAFWNGAGEFIAINSWIDRDDMLEIFGIDEEANTVELASMLAQMDPAKRAELYEPIYRAALEATDGNETRATKFVSQLYGLTPDSTGSETVWSLVDVATLTPFGWFARLASNAKKATVANTIAKVNPEAGANIVVAASKSDEVAKASGISKTNAAETASPFPYENVSIGAVDGIEDSVVNAVKTQVATVRQSLETEASYISKESVLTAEEQVAAQTRALERVNSEKWAKDTGFSATNAQIVDKTEDGFVVKFEGINSEGVKVKANLQAYYTRNDVGSYAPDVKFSAVTSGFTSPSVWANKFQQTVVEKATALGFKEEAMLTRTLAIGREVTKPLSKDGIAKVDQILMKGDEFTVDGVNTGKVYTIRELMYDGVDGVKLNLDETKAYFGIREMWDNIHKMSESAYIKNLKFDDFRTVGKFDNQNVYGKVVTTRDVPNDVYKVMDLRTRSSVSIDDLAKELKDAKVEIVRLHKSLHVKNDIYEYAAIRKGSARKLPDTGVLPYRTGYVPRIRQNANYVVHAPSPRTVNGKKGQIIEAKGLYNSKKEAEAEAQRLTQQTGIEHKASYDREIDPDLRTDLLGAQMGRPFTGQRVIDRSITHGSGVERINSFEALERNLQAMSNMVHMNTFRMEQMERLRKSAAKYLNDPKNLDSGFRFGVDNPKVNALNSMKTWLDDQFRIPTKSELQWEGVTRQVAEWMEGNRFFLNGKGQNARLWLQREGGKDITARIRGAAFHALLGWYNPAQLMIQASGAAISFSLNPAKFPKIMMQYKAMRANIFQGDDVAKETAKRLGFKEDEYLDTLDAMRRSGIMESVKTNADYQAARLGYGIDQGAVGRAADSGLMFYREGEMFNRGYAWLLAADDYRQLNKVSKLTDNDVTEITKRMAQYTMNLNRSNRAAWQKGWMSIPTQFWQVTTKFTETMLGLGANKALTRAERMRVMLGQTALFGATGVPMGNWLVNSYLSWTGQDVGSMSQPEIAALRQGLVGVTAQAMIGEEIDLASRIAFSAGYDMMVDSVTGDKQFSEVMLGASGALPKRVIGAIQGSGPVLRDFEFSKEDMYVMATELGGIISTFRNAEKAWMMKELGYIPLSNGQRLDTVDWADDWKMLVAQAAGFAPTKMRDYYQIKQTERSLATRRKEAVDTLMRVWNKNLVAGKMFNDDSKTDFHKLFAAVVGRFPESEQIKIMESVNKKLTDNKLQYQESMQKAIESLLENGNSGTFTTRLPFSAQNYREGE